ncbi:MAG: hypothetical protein LBK27_00745 [Treponema sp.]|nr:hypothetical protein [Treponema sp.]
MKNHQKLVFVLAVPALFLLFACASTPKQALLDELDGAIARTEEARKRAADFESGTYFPSDWENAEAEYAAAGQLPRSTDDEVQQAAARYTALADTYDGIFERAIPLYAKDREDEIVALREEAVATGLSGAFPDYLQDVDGEALQALSRYEEKDYYGARDSWLLACAKYRALKTGGDAYNARQEIVRRDFSGYDPDNFNLAEESGQTAVDAYNAGKIDAAREAAEEAALRYHLVLNTAWAAHVAEQKLAADAERQRAQELKAHIAVKAEFDAAAAMYDQAESSVQAEQYTDAVRLYTESAARFTAAGETAEEKRLDAEAAIREAEQKVRESEETAIKAELILEGGES